MDKDEVVYVPNGIEASGTKCTMPFSGLQLSLEIIRQIVLSQKAKDTYPIISLIGLS